MTVIKEIFVFLNGEVINKAKRLCDTPIVDGCVLLCVRYRFLSYVGNSLKDTVSVTVSFVTANMMKKSMTVEKDGTIQSILKQYYVASIHSVKR